MTTDRHVREQLGRLPALPLLRRVAGAALAGGAEPYLVGGVVRDLVLGWEAVDLDVVVVGDALAVARALAAAEGVETRLHDQFGTAKLRWPAGQELDLITARHESYPVPGALPAVTPGTLDDDLRRRDFTINAIAASLAPESFGALVDPLDGRADLVAGTIRALHAGSFRDDPTRMLRAVRYAGRLAFAIEPRTLGWLQGAVRVRALATVSIDRRRDEFVRVLSEPAAAAMIERLAALGLLAQLHPALRAGDDVGRAYADLDRWWPLVAPVRKGGARATPWMARLAILAAPLAPAEARAVAAALHLPAEAATLLDEVVALRRRRAALHDPLPNSALGRLLDPFSAAAIATVAATEPGGPPRAQLLRYLIAVRPLAPTLGGDFLRALGVPPGPIYGRALAALLDRRRDDPTLGVEGERAFLLGWLRDHGALPPDSPEW